ncbi:YqeG family HAD IIIA-type phosphatase [Thermosediminibacter oceani]|uniref:HAD superfamily (Subfamily IIIA) phosphatase, TIGR01668 n=1 Tax=Thermosediminibacter oceani (strain ATCC BAA-1034 / DSM 16646 / JW/IW-1228P) TaxID=555079 RepID=D9RXL8_THEOJ|nr:YqeG family HAD IIIA-type phosphatase [Thermosediminibacter oceani]ADL08092.1 HAD superfamily (subfamily IIIA) phosphatase, TIGR01668 [Thermosediminibacter oceani DSM 16646]
MWKLFRPDLYVQDIFQIDFKYLKQKGIKGILIDLDNTLLPWNSCEIDDKLIEWIRRGREEGFTFCIVSNNMARRIKTCSEKLGIPAVTSGAFKPGKRVFLKGMEIIGTSVNETVFIGDQLFTDVLGAKRLGMMVILVKPLDESEFFWTKIIRRLERKIINFMKRKALF